MTTPETSPSYGHAILSPSNEFPHMNECSYCHWTNTGLWTIKVGEENKLICQTCCQMMANAFTQSNAFLVGKTSELEKRLKALEVMILP